MATLTIRNIDEALKARLRLEAAQHGRSMEEEVRAILRQALSKPYRTEGLGSRIRTHFAHLSDPGVPLPPRDEPPRAADLPE
ncbi:MULTISPECIES: FitA-like ribbon-helix-helix domain-containing protein [Cupriavidus]|uniref:FitA-like ribbon-helix-helix domain-containing protein n=1 Tax=Cupriavidus TaxID=106589 RepID=UPI00037E4920|nr:MULTISPECIES: Arc family DNA-binding protein [Cupriavidus]